MVDVAQRLAKLSPAQRQLLEARLKKNPQVAQPIAIVGMACRLPGAANTEEFWKLIAERRCAVTEVPSDRWDVDRYYDPDPDTPGKMSIRWGAFVDGVREFDSMFFGITPREAVRMDPQQRLLLEVSWEAFENAGISPDQLAGTATGVFVGIGGNDYSKLPNEYDNYLEYIDAHMGTGNALSVAANRISYIMDLRGPSLAVDTACSSGLVGVHLAVQSLRNGDCDAAIAGAVNLILSPEVTIAFSKARMLSPSGQCRPFDAAANGYVRGEGCGMLVLKRLTDATRDGDHIMAVIRGSAINQDGRTSGITAPNSLSQMACIRAALSSAGLDTSQVSYVEAHGTGTPLGDPIEFQSLTKLFARRKDDDQTVHVSSVKANVGHTETVSGIAGLIKVIMMMRHGVIPPQAALEELNPNINLEGTRLAIPRELVSWRSNGNRVAGISSFGFGGTNSHVVIESVTASREAAVESVPERPTHVLAVSAKAKNTLPTLLTRYADRLETLPDEEWVDFCYSANTGRAHFNLRTAITAEDRASMIAGLRAAADGKRSPRVRSDEVRIATKPKIAFLFTGQGSQYVGMANQLYETHPVFKKHFDHCNEILREHREFSILDVVYPQGDQSPLDETTYTQPALFALEYALAKLWQSWGVEPNLLLGHSVGEYVAACIGGVFSVEDGLRLIAKRAELMQRLPQNGKMAVIFASRDRVQEVLEEFGDRVAVATANGPENNVISGAADVVEKVVAAFEKKGVGTQRLNVSHAFHSPLMDPMLDEFEAFAATLEYSRPTIPIAANRTGTIVDSAAFDAAYWRDHIRNCVEFATGMLRLEEEGVHAMVEIGPTASLLGMGRRCLPNSKSAWIPSLRKGKNDWEMMAAAVSQLYVLGVNIDWRGFDQPWKRNRITVPNYPFLRNEHWIIDASRPAIKGGGRGPSLHPLLGSEFTTAFDSRLYEARFSADNPKHLRDHVVQGSIVVPAAAYIEQGLAIAQLQFGPGDHAVENLAIQHALFLPLEGCRVVQVMASPEMGGRSSFDTYSISGETQEKNPKWQLHVSGSIVHKDALAVPRPAPIDLEEVRRRIVREVSRQETYDVMSARNLVYGESFQVLGSVLRTASEVIAEVELPAAVKQDLDKYHLHPALGDALMQAVAGTVPLEPNGDFTPYTYVPVRLKRARILGALQDEMRILARRISRADHPSPETVESDVFLLDAEGNVLVEFAGVIVQRVGRAIDGVHSDDVSDWVYGMTWRPQPFNAEKPARLGTIAILTDQSHVGEQLAKHLVAAGAKPVLIRPGAEYQPGTEQIVVRCTEADDFSQALASCNRDASCPLTSIVHLWTLDCGDPTTTDDVALQRLREQSLASLLRVTQQAARLHSNKPPAILVATRGGQQVTLTGEQATAPQPVTASQSAIWGMGRVAAIEHPELHLRLIDLDPAEDASAAANHLLEESRQASAESQVAYRGGLRHVARLEHAPERLPGHGAGDAMRVPKQSPYQLRIKESGSFDSLAYEPFERPSPGEGQIEVEVHATGLNFSDVLKALGLYPGITDVIVPMGIEVAGVVSSVGPGVTRFQVGDEVMGVAPYSFASHCITADYAMVKKPASIDHEEASTIPITFLTAYYGLVRLAQVQPGERVLIHAGAGGVGLAAIQIAKHLGAEVFATAGSDEKRDFLRSLGVQHVMNSRTLDFADQIREITGREGVDVVLNSLPGDAITASLGVLRAYGRFLEIGKTDIYSNTMIGLLPFQDNLSYFAIDLDRMLRQKSQYIQAMFAEMMSYFEQGVFQPLPFTRFPTEKTINAFRYMAQRKNIGKVVVSADAAGEADEDEAPDTFHATQQANYLITGGLGALGLQVAEWLAGRGATHVTLLSRRSPDETARQSVEMLAQCGLRVATIQGDVADRPSLDAALQQVPADFPPLKGVFHAAGVLADGVMFDMSLEQLGKPLAAKVNGAWNLHDATRELDLDAFVLFSSVACILGSPGQSNYAAGNAYLDGLAAHRCDAGLPATSINWGPWAHSGMAKDAGLEEQLASRGMGMLPAQPALNLMGDLIATGYPQTAVMMVHWPDLVRASGGSVASLLKIVTEGIELGTHGGDSAEDRALRKSLANLSVPEREVKLCGFFAAQLAHIMGLEVEDIEVATPLNTMGLDSLMAIELKNKIESQLQMALPMAVFMNEPSVASLAKYVSENFGQEASEDAEQEATPALAPE